MHRSEQTVLPKRLTLVTGERGGGDCGELVAEVGFVVADAMNFVVFEIMVGFAQLGFVGDGTNHQVGMCDMWIRSRGDYRMAGLNGLMGRRKVAANKDVDVRRVRLGGGLLNLQHASLPMAKWAVGEDGIEPPSSGLPRRSSQPASRLFSELFPHEPSQGVEP